MLQGGNFYASLTNIQFCLLKKMQSPKIVIIVLK